MSADLFLRSRLEKNCQPVPESQRLCSRREKNGFGIEHIHPDCLQVEADGRVQVGLSVPAQTWFALLAQLGNVLEITRNSMATLGQFGPVPALVDWHNAVLPRDYSGSFTPNLAEYASLRALREDLEGRPGYGLEADDASGHTFHRIFLSTSDQFEIFKQFVTDYQSPPTEAGQWFSPNHGFSMQRRRALARRVGFLRSRLEEGSTDVCSLPVTAIPHLLAVVARMGLSIRTTHYSQALNRMLAWIPEAPERLKSQAPGVEFFQSDGVGLSLHLPAVAGVWLWRGRCCGCDKQQWTVELADASNAIGLTFSAGEAEQESDWRELLKNYCP